MCLIQKWKKQPLKIIWRDHICTFWPLRSVACCHECVVYHPGSADFLLLQKQSTRRLFIKYVFRKTPRKTPVLDSLFSVNSAKCLKASFSVEHLRATASVFKILVSPQTALLKRWYQKNSDTSSKFLLKVMKKHSR